MMTPSTGRSNETMPLTRRNRNAAEGFSEHVTSDDPRGTRSKPFSASWMKILASVIMVVGVSLLYAVRVREAKSKNKGERIIAKQQWASTDLIYRESFEKDVHLSLHFARPEGQVTNDFVSLGPHRVSLKITRACTNPRFWLRLVGDALVYIPLSVDGDDLNSWSGKFYIPLEGSYFTDARWYGCDGEDEYYSPEEPTHISAQGMRTTSSLSNVLPDSAWIASSHFPSLRRLPSYIWTGLKVPPNSTTFLEVNGTVVLKEGNPINQAFSGLSNYELVCWIGSKSAADIRFAFLELRKELFKGQRPFKFHLYPISSFEKPDQFWEEGKKRAFRKCKHVLVSVDQLENPISQEEYKSQVTTFLHHLVKCFKDPTFPIWMFTVNEAPMKASMCTTATRSSTNHPCNTVLKDLFANSPFPSHVRLLDNTDVSLPQFGGNQNDIMAVIAMRIYYIVGTQVALWRASGQRGDVDGLHRGGKVERNDELLIPYAWN